MDPHANLKEQLRLSHEIVQMIEGYPPEQEGIGWEEEVLEPVKDCAEALSGLVVALDEWRRQGGFDPYVTIQSPDKRVRDALSDILNYNWPSEHADYDRSIESGDIEPMPGSGHVFEALVTVREWLDQREIALDE